MRKNFRFFTLFAVVALSFVFSFVFVNGMANASPAEPTTPVSPEYVSPGEISGTVPAGQVLLAANGYQIYGFEVGETGELTESFEIGTYSTYFNMNSVAWISPTTFLVGYGNGVGRLETYSAVPGQEPQLLWGQGNDYFQISDLVMSNTVAFLAESTRVSIRDFVDPAAPQIVATIGGITLAQSLDLAGQFLFVTAYGGVRIYDVADLAAPVQVGFVETSGNNYVTLAVTGTQLIAGAYDVASTTGFIEVYNVANPAAPVMVDSVQLDGSFSVGDVWLNGQDVFVEESMQMTPYQSRLNRYQIIAGQLVAQEQSEIELNSGGVNDIVFAEEFSLAAYGGIATMSINPLGFENRWTGSLFLHLAIANNGPKPGPEEPEYFVYLPSIIR